MLMGKTSVNSADSEANWSGVVNFHCMQMTLYSVECVSGLFLVKTEMTCHVHHVFLICNFS